MQSIDLNLLRVLDAVLEAGSVTGAAERLHLSVPATSHALTRLREALGDPLLVRAGRRLVPTPRAQELREPLARWMAQGRTMLARDKSAELAQLERVFVVRAPEGVSISFGASLTLALRQIMPLATLRFLPETAEEDATLRDGSIDLDLRHFLPREPEVQTLHLMDLKPVVVVRHDHPLGTRAVTAKRLSAQLHVDVQRRPGAPSPVDDALAALGLAREVVLTVPQANIAALVAARSDLVAILGERMARAMAASVGLKVLPLAFAVEPEPLLLAWHPRHNADPAHALLRQLMLKQMAASKNG
ncbi:MAG: LysR family transcriptional regulator [Burkholderiaceae bacterium]